MRKFFLRTAFLAAYIAVSVILISSCRASARRDAGRQHSGPEKKNYDFIFVCPILENEYWYACIDGMRKADAEIGTRTKVIGPATADNFAVRIVGYMEDAIAEKPDGILLYAGIKELEPLIRQAQDAGIPCVAVDADAPDSPRVAYVGNDSVSDGFKAGETMISLTGGRGRLGILVSSRSADKEMTVVRAFLDTIADYDMDVVFFGETDADPDIAADMTRKMLAEHSDITAIFNTAGYNVTGAARVKKELGRSDLILLGHDDTEENLALVREGVIDALIVQRIGNMGYQSVCLLKNYLDKGSVPDTTVDTGVILVTKENADTYRTADGEAARQTKTVRVGYYPVDGAFQSGFSDGERKSGFAYEYLQTVAGFVGWEYEYVYGSRQEVMDKLAAGEADLVAGVHKTDVTERKLLFSARDMGLDDVPRYFAVNPSRPDIKADLDYAMEQLRQISPDYSAILGQKYFGGGTVILNLTDRERDWLSEKREIAVGYVSRNMPLSGQTDGGEPTGLVSSLAETFSEYLHVPIHLVCYADNTAVRAALRAGVIDAAFPAYSDLWIAEREGFRLTDSVFRDRVMLLYGGKYSDNLTETVAVADEGLLRTGFIGQQFPDAKIRRYHTRLDALEAVRNGGAKSMIGSSVVLQRLLTQYPRYQELSVAYLDTEQDFCFAVRMDGGTLAAILNKAIRQMQSGAVTSIIAQYSSVERVYTLPEIARRYAVPLVFVMGAFIAVLIATLALYYRKTQAFNRLQQKAQTELEAALVKANEASRAKTNFLSAISHDIRTPMNAIVGMTAIAARNIDNRERVSDCLNKIKLSSGHLMTLINDVLDISKIESGRVSLNPVDFSLKEMMRSIMSIIGPQARGKGLHLDVSMENIPRDRLFADDVRLNQIFMNILSNAVKYTPRGGSIAVSLSEESAAEETDSGAAETAEKQIRLVFSVADTGIGMSRAFMKNMYEIFARERDSRVNKIQGSGLGLAIVKQTVDLMGGTIDAESEENKGTKFTVRMTLPYIDTDGGESGGAAEQQTEETLAAGLRGARILVAEDNDLNWEIISEILGIYGISSERAENGQICVDKIAGIITRKSGGAMAGNGAASGAESGGAAASGAETDAAGNGAASGAEESGESERGGAAAAGGAETDGGAMAGAEKSGESERGGAAASGAETDAAGNGAASGAEESGESERGGAAAAGGAVTDSAGESAESGGTAAADGAEKSGDAAAADAENGRAEKSAESGRAAETDAAATAAAGAEMYDLILMDIQMPVLNGRDATRKIRALGAESAETVPIIAMTADAFAEDITACIKAGMNGHVAKPVDTKKLFIEMNRVLRRTGGNPPAR